MRKVLKWLPALIALAAMCIPANAMSLVDCIKKVEDDYNACIKQAIVGGIIGGLVGGFVGSLGGIIGMGVGASAGFLTGAGPRVYACDDNFIRESEECYATYPLVPNKL
jgi:uncharacterized membrane protein